MNERDGIIGFLIGIAVGALAALMITVSALDKTDYRKQAIEHGYAEYNQTTGAWQWIENETAIEKAP